MSKKFSKEYNKYVDINNRMWDIIEALEDSDFNSLSPEDAKLAAEMIEGLKEEDLIEVEEVVKEQMILELAGVERVFKDEDEEM